MTEELRKEIGERLQGMIHHVTHLQECLQTPGGDWKEVIRQAEMLEVNAGAIRNLIIQRSSQKEQPEDDDELFSSDVISPAE